MAVEIELIKKEQQKTSIWSGGTTTQLAIYPKNGDYSKRNFIWRLSSATVDAEESTFTSLPHIERILMILEGEIILEHEGRYKKVLKKFDQDSFSGSWTTRSIGRATDFNLMMKEGCRGKVMAMTCEKEQIKTIDFHAKTEFKCYTQSLYCAKGKIQVELWNENIYELNEKDVLLIKSGEYINMNYKVKNVSTETAEFIVADIYYQ